MKIKKIIRELSKQMIDIKKSRSVAETWLQRNQTKRLEMHICALLSKWINKKQQLVGNVSYEEKILRNF